MNKRIALKTAALVTIWLSSGLVSSFLLEPGNISGAVIVGVVAGVIGGLIVSSEL